MKSMVKLLLGTVLLLVTVISAGSSEWAQRQAPSSMKEFYAKQEYEIPMRDGVKLFTVVYTPRNTTQNYPILLQRTPYSAGPYGPNKYRPFLGPSPQFEKEGFIFAYQDVRGRYKSGGTWVDMRPIRDVHHGPHQTDETTDTYDTVEWLVKHIPHNNGRVGLWGVSYVGFYAAVGMVNAPPALKAVSPQAPQADWFVGDDIHHDGAFLLASLFDFAYACDCYRPNRGFMGMSCGPGFHFPTPDGYKFFLDNEPLPDLNSRYLHSRSPLWNEVMEHGTYDSFWRARDILPHLRHVGPAVLAVGGWYDANDFYGTIHVFESVKRQSPSTPDFLAVGPWLHGEWTRGNGDQVGQLNFHSDAGPFFRDHIELPFFNDYLKGKGTPNLPKAYVFDTGADTWSRFDDWPPRNARIRSIYLGENHSVSFELPTNTAGDTFDQYLSDPANPVPFMEKQTTQMNPDYMGYDQRFSSKRPDVLVYESKALTKDFTIAGPVMPRLFVSSTGTDSDWIVKLIDVHPGDGFEELVRGSVLRAKFRNSLERPEPLVPDKVTPIDFTMDDVYHTFKASHQIMVQIQSTWFPLVDLNPQSFVDIYHAKASDFHKASERVYHSRRYPSQIRLYVP